MKKFSIIKCEHYFRTIRKYVAQYFRKYSIWEILFMISSLGFVAFGILCMWLNHLRGLVSGFTDDLLTLLILLGVGCLIYCTVAHLSKRNWFFKSLSMIILIGYFLFSSMFLLSISILGDELLEDYYAGDIVSMRETESDYLELITNSRLFGHGMENAYPRDYEALPALSYEYGLWILILYGILLVIWSISAICAYLRLCSRWHEWVFLICFIMCLTIPGALVDVPREHLFEFSSIAFMAEALPFINSASCLIHAIPLSLMCAVTKLNNDAL